MLCAAYAPCPLARGRLQQEFPFIPLPRATRSHTPPLPFQITSFRFAYVGSQLLETTTHLRPRSFFHSAFDVNGTYVCRYEMPNQIDAVPQLYPRPRPRLYQTLSPLGCLNVTAEPGSAVILIVHRLLATPLQLPTCTSWRVLVKTLDIYITLLLETSHRP